MTKLMIGTDLAAEMVAKAAARAENLRQKTGVQPCLATVLVGDDPASATYVRMKQNRSKKAGIGSRSECRYEWPSHAGERQGRSPARRPYQE